MLNLQDPIENLHLLNTSHAKALQHLGINTVTDLLYHLPRDWQDLSHILPIAQAKPNERINLKAKLIKIEEQRSKWRRLHILNALFSDVSGSIVATWFNQPFLRYALKPNREYYLSGKVYAKDTLQLQNPTFELAKENTIHTAGIVPVYDLTAGVTQKQLRYWISLAMPLTSNIPDLLTSDIKKRLGLPDLAAGLRHVHFPQNQEQQKNAYKRFAFEELFMFQLALQSFKAKLASLPAPAIKLHIDPVKNFVRSLPFKLTHSQRQAAWDILNDLSKPYPMNRLLEGEVGSGKTVVAGLAMLQAALAGYQSVMLAPTEILALQHYQTLKELLNDTELEIAVLTRSHKLSTSLQLSPSPGEGSSERLLKKISSGHIKIIIGTHALLQEHVNFQNIGLLVIDEQHRFGVKQRAHLAKENYYLVPHLLSMTATPIPRTLALAFYGDLDISELRELPLGRKKIITRLVEPEKRQLAYEFIRKQLNAGRQMYVVTPLIESPSPNLPHEVGGTGSAFFPPLVGGIEGGGIKAARSEVKKLQDIFPEFKIGLLHGRLRGEEKKDIMDHFKAGKIEILVTTTVIEVGVDVANAAVMIIENAERFGLSQIHQLRGRVGRSEYQSFCLLFAGDVNAYTHERLMAVVNINDGFELAERDLELRGSGEIIGTRQSGFVPFKVAKLSDRSLINLAKKEAENLLKSDPKLEQYPLLKQKTEQISKNAHLE